MMKDTCNFFLDLDISIIVAKAQNNVIGYKGQIPWNIQGEQKRFKELTTGNVVIMGRVTFEEIFDKLKKPLPNRINIVISSTKDFSNINCPTFADLKTALIFCRQNFSDKKIYISGGEKLYKESLQYAKKLYITEVQLKVKGDTFFPKLKKENYFLQNEELMQNSIPYKYQTYIKKN